jgi:dTDP-4-amino-4,6-dideoxygalactose transaminase
MRLSAIPAQDRVPIYRPYLRAPVQEAAGAALEAGRLSRESEEGLERYLGLSQRRVVSTNSCTEALHIARHLRAKGAGRCAAVGPDRVPRRSGA